MHLLRTIRNLWEHYDEQKEAIRKEIIRGQKDIKKYLAYWLNLYPSLLSELYILMKDVTELQAYYKKGSVESQEI